MSGKWYGFQLHVFSPAYGVNCVDVGLQTVDNVFVAADQMKLGLKLKRNVKKCLVSMMNTCSTVLHGALHLTAAVQTRYEFLEAIARLSVAAFPDNHPGAAVVAFVKGYLLPYAIRDHAESFRSRVRVLRGAVAAGWSPCACCLTPALCCVSRFTFGFVHGAQHKLYAEEVDLVYRQYLDNLEVVFDTYASFETFGTLGTQPCAVKTVSRQ